MSSSKYLTRWMSLFTSFFPAEKNPEEYVVQSGEMQTKNQYTVIERKSIRIHFFLLPSRETVKEVFQESDWDVKRERGKKFFCLAGNKEKSKSNWMRENKCLSFYFLPSFLGISLELFSEDLWHVKNVITCEWEGEECVQYSAPRLNGQRLSSHFLAVKAGWPIIRANLM